MFLSESRQVHPFGSPLHAPPESNITPISAQLQSPFLSNLPAELRNEIYHHVFTSNPNNPPTTSAQPLSLLLTCRQISHEATIIAFHNHTFHVAFTVVPTFVLLRDSISHLSAQQTCAITALMYDLGTEYKDRTKEAVDIMANSILLFPNFSYFELRARQHKKRKNVSVEPAPSWLYRHILKPFTTGLSVSWQKGEYWSVYSPRLENSDVEILNKYYIQDACKKNYVGSVVVDKFPGVHMCMCDSETACWLSSTLVQESGRMVVVNTIFRSPEDPPTAWEGQMDAKPSGRLKPGVQPPQDIKTMPQKNFGGIGVTGYAFEADDEYWEGLRRRNWTLGVTLRGLFSSADDDLGKK
ncbi:hypothetical protein P153DRAFT_435217 [Dothidotthia symphoricarpi CBS 119687]|uniref:F-box domain-containing protein n=1 Tax=Dothidotthia symphoricarpi CBS 119687 TaxID=1392245 RepID=A0A6A5ZY12_9PLEO|nr:uncharacterized protein P153DRAFT_435217 [Dothidotthia symphoricarpi CBS 119687]KAF2124480.1 hypothetical protein P153DRAFT_435217 [Dothidotthia symphoricarpi CBS 119687]